MFAAVKKVTVRKRRFGKMLFPPPERYVASTGLPYYVIPLPVIDGKPVWEYTARIAGGCAGRIIAPAGLEPPEGLGLETYYPAAFASEAVFAAAMKILESTGGTGRGLTVTVFDPSGLLGKVAGSLPGVSARVRIVTDKAEKYGPARKEAMERFGASLIFCGDGRGSDAVLASVSACPPGGEYRILSFLGRPAAARAVLPDGVTKPDCPGLDNLAFCGALAELCGVNIDPTGLFDSGAFASVEKSGAEMLDKSEVFTII